jgi:hypothetical protein
VIPGDLCVEFHYFEAKEEVCVILERCGEFPKWEYQVLTPTGVRRIPSGSLRRVWLYEAW